MGKYGTNLEGFGAFEGGVNADKGAPLVSTSSDGETALLFGPAALREIQAGVANGDFAIPPDAAGDTITEENPLPYWTFTDDDSAGAITCKVVTAAGGNSILWTVAANTTTGKTATLSRYVAVPSSQDKAYAFYPEFYVASVTNSTSRNIIFTLQFYTSDFVASGTAITRTYAFSDFASGSAAVFLLSDTSSRLQVPANARLAKISIQVDTTGTNASESTLSLAEVKMLTAYPMLLAADRKDAGASGPGAIWKTNGSLYISADIPTTWVSGTLSSTQPRISLSNSVVSLTASTFSGQITGLAGADITGNVTIDDSLAVVGNIGFDGVIYGSSALTGPYINLAGTNNRLWTVSASAADLTASTAGTVAGILITKSTAGQPTTNINGTGTTDAFADALRNGGIASDNTNGRFYVYNGGAWKFAALTTPSDSRLKEEITAITGALDTLRQLVPVAFKWKRPEAHPRTDAVDDDGKRLGFIADQVATTDLKRWVDDMGVGDLERDLVEDTDGRVLAVNIPQNEMEALVVQALLDIDARLKALESR